MTQWRICTTRQQSPPSSHDTLGFAAIVVAEMPDRKSDDSRKGQEARLLAAFDRLVEPLVAAGWTAAVRRTETEHGPDASALGELERGGKRIDVELFLDGMTQVFRGGGRRTDEPDPPLFQTDGAEALAQFAARAWG